MDFTVKAQGPHHYFELMPAVAKKLLDGGHKRIVCTINGLTELHCAIQRTKDGVHYIHLGAPICKKLKLQDGTKIKVDLKPDDSDYQFAMPEEMKEVLASDPEGNEAFHRLTPGKQRSLIYGVATLKSIDKRIAKSLKIIAALK